MEVSGPFHTFAAEPLQRNPLYLLNGSVLKEVVNRNCGNCH